MIGVPSPVAAKYRGYKGNKQADPKRVLCRPKQARAGRQSREAGEGVGGYRATKAIAWGRPRRSSVQPPEHMGREEEEEEQKEELVSNSGGPDEVPRREGEVPKDDGRGR